VASPLRTLVLTVTSDLFNRIISKQTSDLFNKIISKHNMMVADGRLPAKSRNPQGQLSVYLLLGDTQRETYRLMTCDKYP